jgi:hypothetical protein
MGKRVWHRDAAKERFWRRAMAAHRRSGLTIREFCSRRSLSEPLFYAWRRELARRDGRPTKASARPERPGIRCANRSAPVALGGASLPPAPRFVSVQVAADAAPVRGAARIEVLTPSGHTLRVPAGVDRQTLADVLAALETRPC